MRNAIPGFQGARLTEQRLKKRWTMDDLADQSGVSKSLVSRAENGQSVPDPRALKAIAAALDIPILDLFEAEILGAGLLRLRIARGLTQQDVAESVPGLSLAQYQNLERGTTQRLHPADGRELAELFGVDDDTLRQAHRWTYSNRTR